MTDIIRTNAVAGKLDVDISDTDTVITSDGLIDLDAIGTDQIAKITLISIDFTSGRIIDKEILHVTDHSLDSNEATVLRGREGTTALSWSAGTYWRHDATASEFNGFIVNEGATPSFQANTRANQPAAGTIGRIYVVIDELVIERDNGTSWEQIVDLNHRNNTSNPHSVTHNQTSPPTNNPHSVTSAQVGAVASEDIDYGIATFSGDGAITTFTISHALSAVPTIAFVQATTADTRDNMPALVNNKTSTTFDVVLPTAPPSGTDNVEFNFWVIA